MNTDNAIQRIAAFAKRLEDAHIHYRLEINRPNAVMFAIVVPGERWEVEFLDDGGIETEVFRSDGTIAGEESLETVFGAAENA